MLVWIMNYLLLHYLHHCLSVNTADLIGSLLNTGYYGKEQELVVNNRVVRDALMIEDISKMIEIVAFVNSFPIT